MFCTLLPYIATHFSSLEWNKKYIDADKLFAIHLDELCTRTVNDSSLLIYVHPFYILSAFLLLLRYQILIHDR